MGSSAKQESSASMGLRLLVPLLCICSLILLLKSKQTVQRSTGLGTVSTQIKYSDASGLIFLVFANVLVAAYSSMSFLGLTPSALGKGCAGKVGRWAIFACDQISAYVLLSAVSAATEVLYLADKGMAKTQWEALCETYGYFCHTVTVAIVLGFVAVILLAVIAVLSARCIFHNFYKRALYSMKMQQHTSLT